MSEGVVYKNMNDEQTELLQLIVESHVHQSVEKLQQTEAWASLWWLTVESNSEHLLKYTFEVLVLLFSATLYFYFTAFQREILYFSLHSIYLIPLVTLQIQINNTKYNQ